MLSDLTMLLADTSNERLNVEYKAWLDIGDSQQRAKLARHLAAICNFDGGYLVFGVNDRTRELLGSAQYDVRAAITQDAISGIVRKYLAPVFQCEVRVINYSNVDYAIVIVPGHGSSPVIAVAGGPQIDGRVVGISQGIIYYRDVGPQSSAIARAEQWSELFERCLSRRADILASIMRQAINIRSSPSSEVEDLLRAVCDVTSEDFRAQVDQDVGLTGADAQALRLGAGSHVTLGYAVLGENGRPIRIESPTSINSRVNVALHRYADYGWTYFYQVRTPERAPQYHTTELFGQERTYVEGMRVANSAIYFGSAEYWRVYEDGFWCISQSYREDYNTEVNGCDPQVLSTLQCLMRFHGLLAHARLLGQELPNASLVALRMDWKGLEGRRLVVDHRQGGSSRIFSSKTITTNRYAKTLTFKWSEIRDDYFSALKRLCMAFFVIFDQPDIELEERITREWMESQFSQLTGGQVKFF